MPTITCVSHLAQLDELKSVIKAVLISEKSKDVTPFRLNNLYKELEDQDIPYKDYKFTNLVDFLKSLNDVCKVRPNNQDQLCVYYIDNEKTKHISRLVSLSKTKNTKAKQHKAKYRALQCGNTVSPYVLYNIFNKLSKKLSFINENRIRKQDVLGELANNNGGYLFYNIDNLEKQLAHYNHILYYDDDFIHFKINSSTNNSRFSNQNQQSSSLLFKSVSDMIREKTKIRLQELVEKHPEGIGCSDLPRVFCREFKVDLEYNDLGFNSILEFIIALPDILKIVRLPASKKQLVIDARVLNSDFSDSQSDSLDSSKKSSKQSEDNTPLAAVPTVVSPPVYKTLIQDNVVSCGEIVEQINIAFLINEKYLDVTVSEVFYPSFFWVTLLKNRRNISYFTKKMTEFYNEQRLDNYEISSILLQPGLNVACPFADAWYRGVVTKIKENKIVVLLYDCGQLNVYKPHQIFFLDKKFSFFPVQAIPCSLYNVRPRDKFKWEREECKAFSAKVLNKSFSARIDSINEEKNFMIINLLTPNINISDWMVSDGLAAVGHYDYLKHDMALKLYQQCLKNPKELLEKQVESERIKENLKIMKKKPSTPMGYLSMEQKREALKKFREKLSNSSNSSTISVSNLENSNEKSNQEYTKVVDQDDSSEYSYKTANSTADSSLLNTSHSSFNKNSTCYTSDTEISYASAKSKVSLSYLTTPSYSVLDSDDEVNHRSNVGTKKNNNFNKVGSESCNRENLQFVESNKGRTEYMKRKTFNNYKSAQSNYYCELQRLINSTKRL